METHIDILQQFMALNREFDTDVPIEVNEAIEELINENFKLKVRVEDLEFALVDENRKRQEYETALEYACDELDYASDVLSDCHADDCNLHTRAGYFVNKAIRELK